ncbi:hypothetical protein O1L55_02405 [Streptomyces albulus]|nr:hypothetical protein [Streptomyces noursei]
MRQRAPGSGAQAGYARPTATHATTAGTCAFNDEGKPLAEIAGEWVSEADLVQVDVDDQAPPIRCAGGASSGSAAARGEATPESALRKS